MSSTNFDPEPKLWESYGDTSESLLPTNFGPETEIHKKFEKFTGLLANVSIISLSPSSASEEISTLASAAEPSPSSLNTYTAESEPNFEALTDPAIWPQVISNSLRLSITEIGPIQVKNFKFPINDFNRSFSDVYFFQKIREW